MENPSVVNLTTKNTWYKVASSIKHQLFVLSKYSRHNYYFTYRLAGEDAPTTLDDAIVFLSYSLDISVPENIDVYVYCLLDNGKVTLQENRHEYDVHIQDQDSPAVIAYFNEVQNTTTLATTSLKESREITLTDATGVEVGSYLILYNITSNRYYFGTVVNIDESPTVVLDTPLDHDFDDTTIVRVTITNMNVEGSMETPRIFGLRNPTGEQGILVKFDVTRIIFECTADSAVDLSKFANITALANGLVLRKKNEDYHNIFNVKNNAEIAGILYDFAIYASTNPVQGIDGFIARLTFAGQEKIGVVQRLGFGEDLQFLVQDDLSDITSFKIRAEGHEVID